MRHSSELSRSQPVDHSPRGRPVQGPRLARSCLRLQQSARVVRCGRHGEPIQILRRLRFNADQGMPGRLGFDDTDRLAVGVQQIVGEPGFEREFGDRDPPPSRQVQVGIVLNDPAGGHEPRINPLPGLLFGGIER